ncbi:NUDIX hydrolase [Metabacillus idriensis]|uniref:NUDIX hydrolase n=1 Tax=Metabacillus idriensis TaxID=324768 RepID=UPI002812F920|nr:NUDIX hydrolase [Metabacillus idriensis]MDR0139579.1 NUDIX hydrolase [Metabacillus idriensis]
MKRVNVVYVLLYNDTTNKILMVKNKGKRSSLYYTLPGGAVEDGETLDHAAIREVKEETGLEVSVHGMIHISEAFVEERGHHAIFFTFLGSITGGKQEIIMPGEIEEITWMDAEQASKYLHFAAEQGELTNQSPSIPYRFIRNL